MDQTLTLSDGYGSMLSISLSPLARLFTCRCRRESKFSSAFVQSNAVSPPLGEGIKAACRRAASRHARPPSRFHF
jgi:hypothetical protein